MKLFCLFFLFSSLVGCLRTEVSEGSCQEEKILDREGIDGGLVLVNLAENPTLRLTATSGCPMYRWAYQEYGQEPAWSEGDVFNRDTVVGEHQIALYSSSGSALRYETHRAVTAYHRSEQQYTAATTDVVLDVDVNCCASFIYLIGAKVSGGIPTPSVDGEYAMAYDGAGRLIGAGSHGFTFGASHEPVPTGISYGTWRFILDRTSPGSPFLGAAVLMAIQVNPDPEYRPPDPADRP